MTDPVLVRHAATAWSGLRYCGRTDLPLTPDGAAAAAAVGAALATSVGAATRIVASPLLRARETAAAIANAIGSDGFTIDERWSETDFGAAEGLTYLELEAAHPGLAARVASGDIGIDWPGGETAEALRGRIEDAWRDLAAARGSWVVVSHGGPLRIAIALAIGIEPSQVIVPAPGTFWQRAARPA